MDVSLQFHDRSRALPYEDSISRNFNTLLSNALTLNTLFCNICSDSAGLHFSRTLAIMDCRLNGSPTSSSGGAYYMLLGCIFSYGVLYIKSQHYLMVRNLSCLDVGLWAAATAKRGDYCAKIDTLLGGLIRDFSTFGAQWVTTIASNPTLT